MRVNLIFQGELKKRFDNQPFELLHVYHKIYSIAKKKKKN